MNYRHIYHAGNFADVFKHILLISLLDFLKQKEKPFCYLETHAGAGMYDLFSKETSKTKEFSLGISKIIAEKQKNPPLFVKTYLDVVQRYGFPCNYPGSPLIAQASLRSMDRMVLMEMHPEEHIALKSLFRRPISGEPAVAIHHQDGYLGIKAFLPPKEKRGLIFIDPPFEQDNEWKHIILNVSDGLKRFSTGVFAIWYPIKDKKAMNGFYEDVKTNFKEVAIAELAIYPLDAPLGLTGCGLAVINPPWQWSESINGTLSFLWSALSVNGAGGYDIRML
jgi:23S rRNA (adenine2030-N6)-methyltransferase